MDISTRAVALIQQEIHAKKSFVVEFFAPWCGPCKTYGPALHKFCAEKLTPLYLINGDLSDQNVETIMNMYQVNAFPTTLVFKHGKMVLKITGANLSAVKNLF